MSNVRKLQQEIEQQHKKVLKEATKLKRLEAQLDAHFRAHFILDINPETGEGTLVFREKTWQVLNFEITHLYFDRDKYSDWPDYELNVESHPQAMRRWLYLHKARWEELSIALWWGPCDPNFRRP